MLKFRWKEGHRPVYKTGLSTGADLTSTQEVTIPGNSMRLVPLGVWIKESDGIYDIQLRARSSLFRKWDCLLANGVGTIDMDYRDEIQAPLYNTLPHPITIPAGTPLVQLVIGKGCQVKDFLNTQETRKGGFGSTDREGKEL